MLDLSRVIHLARPTARTAGTYGPRRRAGAARGGGGDGLTCFDCGVFCMDRQTLRTHKRRAHGARHAPPPPPGPAGQAPCRFGAACRYRTTTCRLWHPRAAHDGHSPAAPRRFGATCRFRTTTCRRAHPGARAPPAPVPSPAQAVPAPAVPTATCVVCFDSVEADAATTTTCAEQHTLCSGCLSGYVSERCDLTTHLELLRETSGRLRCPVPGCSAEALSDVQIARGASEQAATQYFAALLQLAHSTGRQEALSEAEAATAAHEVLAAQLREQFPNARMCGSCAFGPVEHHACSTLSSHHGERVGRNGVVNNACPRCGWFSATVNDWPLWDGRMPERV